MSQLRSILDQLALVDPEALTIDELDVEITEIIRGREFFDVLLARHVKALSDQNGYAQLGFPSPTAYLKHRSRMSGGHAQQIVAWSKAGGKAPSAFRAWEDGRLSTDQTRHLFAAAESVPDAYPQAEEKLLDIVDGLSVSDTGKAIEYWRQAVDGPGELDRQAEMLRRGLSLSETSGGMRRVDGWMTRTAGDALEAALGAFMPPPTEDDLRTTRQRRHDALEDLCRDWLDHGDTPTVGGEKPHIMVLADLAALPRDSWGHPREPPWRHPRCRYAPSTRLRRLDQSNHLGTRLRKSSTWEEKLVSGRLHSVEPSSPEIATARAKDATGTPGGAISTISTTGPTAERPT